MFIGYNEKHRAYQLIHIETGSLIFSQDVVFDEEREAFQPFSPVLSFEVAL